MTAIDPGTGLPALPEGYFWRVAEVGDKRYRNEFYVKLMRRRVVGPAKEVERAMGSKSRIWGPTLEDAVRARAGHVYKDHFGKKKIDLFSIAGDYPPRKLGGA